MRKLPFVLLNLLLAFLLLWAVIAFVLGKLDDYTEHGEVVLVPDFTGMSLAGAEEAAAGRQLRITVVDSVYGSGYEPGTVIEQYPADSLPVKRNRLVHLTINAISPEKVAVPDLRNAAYRQTIQTLERKGFKVGRLEYVPSEFRHLVLGLKKDGEELEPGTLLVKGSSVDLVLGSGTGNNLVRMPLLAGKPLKEVPGILQKFYLNLGPVTFDESVRNVRDSLVSTVFLQLPEAGEAVEAGTEVGLEVTLDREKLQRLDSLQQARQEERLKLTEEAGA